MLNPIVAIKNAHNYVRLYSKYNPEVADKLSQGKYWEGYRLLPWSKLGIFNKVEIIKYKQNKLKANQDEM